MPSKRRAALLHALFFLSGAAGLVYQVVWSRLLEQVFGVTAYAVTAVLATFLAGLALGGWLLGRIADRADSPLRLYALLEVGIAAAALLGSWTVRAHEPLHLWAASRFAPDSAALLLSRCALASLVVIPPTFLMGGTLPALTRATVGGMERMGRQLGLLYALNTAGAVAGSVLSGFVLIRAAGLHPTLWIAVACNVAVGAAAFALAGGPARARPPAPALASGAGGTAPPAPATPAPAVPSPDLWLLAAIALSGVASLALEVVWTRILVLVVGTSTYAFVTMLAAFLVGIAVGSAVARTFVDRLRDPRRIFGWIQAGIAASTVATVPLLRALIDGAQRWVDAPDRTWLEAMAGRFGFSFAVMLVPTTLMGMTFPLAMRIAARGVDTLGARLGRVYGANTAGNIAGALLGGFVLLPNLGLQRSVAVLAILNLAAAGWALLPWRDGLRGWRVLVRAAPVSALLWGCIALVALWRPAPLPATGGGDDDSIAYYREGRSATVKVFQSGADGRQRIMAIDGVVIGQSGAGVDKKQQVLAHFPFVLQPRSPATILTIGLGTGILAGELARHPGVERVEVVEIAHGVVEGAREFERWNGGALHDPRVVVVEDDGINYLRRSGRRYDTIVSDGKSKSGHAGNAAFFSEEYYESARAHLAPDGAMLQWVPLDLPADDLRTIVRTFERVFPHVYLWIAQESSFLVGQLQPLALDLPRSQRVLDAAETADLRRYGWDRAEEVAGFLLADETTLEPWLGAGGPVNSLEHPVLEFYSPAALAEPDRLRVASNMTALVELRRRAAPAPVRGAAPAVEASFRSAADLVDGAADLARGDLGGVSRIERALSEATPDGLARHWAAEAIFNAARGLDLSGRIRDADALYRQALAAWPALAEACTNLGRDLALEGRPDEGVAFLRRALQLNPELGSAHRELSDLLVATGQVPEALEEARAAVRLAPRSAAARAGLGLALALAGDPAAAVPELLAASRLRPAWPVPLARAAILLATRPGARPAEIDEAERLAQRAVGLAGPADVMALEALAAAQAAGGRFPEAAATEQRAVEAAAAAGDPQLAAAAAAVRERYRRGVPLEPFAAPAR